ncbi:MAG TPA: TolC family protein [Gemmataceae bacterium]|nr:TolC family protein [Gemmataceae bacterium]
MMATSRFLNSLAGAGLFFLLVHGAAWAQQPKAEKPKPAETLPAPRGIPDAGESLAPVPSILGPNTQPIDLPSALQLAGVQNPQILLAQERVLEAVALRQLAAAQLLPTLNMGLNFDAHSGALQQSTGNILNVNRQSMYVGLGASAIGAGTVTIPGLVWAGNISEGFYGNLISKQVVRHQQFASLAMRNEMLLRVASAYLELLRAEGHRVIALKNRDEAREVARITTNYAKAKEGRQADANRAAADLEQRTTELLQAENDMLAASARLCGLLGLDPSVRLQAMESYTVPQAIVPPPISLPELLAMALAQRPELGERQNAIRAAFFELQKQKLLPFSPNVIFGYSAGAFGGGSNLVAVPFGNFADREDFDAVMFWSLRNLGLGNLAMVRLAQSNYRSQNLRSTEVLDRIRAEVAAAYARAHARFAQIDSAERGIQASELAFKEDFKRTFNREGLPIEVLDSLRLLTRSRYTYLDAIIDYNLAQFALYVALGQPPADWLARPIPADPATVTSPTPASPK